ncbi:hypothetical protein SCHPADRAFT_497947 [Schizopora paradoxa]|uniref:Uncharacterized protein n=1 Tax=Schizopora paradoxa TaxID=27342 RepID=A0A0H2RGX3_9AGAM|nr:hypothetical protein SCHPADRAFT_497947 [Schizopora paradoxa]
MRISPMLVRSLVQCRTPRSRIPFDKLGYGRFQGCMIVKKSLAGRSRAIYRVVCGTWKTRVSQAFARAGKLPKIRVEFCGRNGACCPPFYPEHAHPSR